MRKWLGLLIVATFGFCAMDVFADDQGAVSAAKMASESQPVPVAEGDAQMAVTAGAPAGGVKAPINFGDYRSTTLATKASMNPTRPAVCAAFSTRSRGVTTS